MLRYILDVVPVWGRILFVVLMLIGLSGTVFAFQKCGAKALLLGNAAVPAAVMGLCD